MSTTTPIREPTIFEEELTIAWTQFPNKKVQRNTSTIHWQKTPVDVIEIIDEEHKVTVVIAYGVRPHHYYVGVWDYYANELESYYHKTFKKATARVRERLKDPDLLHECFTAWQSRKQPKQYARAVGGRGYAL
jgi:hypothetical protein